MTQITPEMVKELREKTGAGMMDCKKALSEASNFEGALQLLREKGLSQAAKKASRVAAEGLVAISVSDHRAAMVEVNCETDFVARNEEFQKLSKDLCQMALQFDASKEANPSQIDGQLLLEQPFLGGPQTVQAVINEKIATMGEKIALRRFASLKDGLLYGHYLHQGGSIGVLVELQADMAELAKNSELQALARDLAMHTAAANPSFLKREEVPASLIAKEREIYKKQALDQGKPEKIVEKMVDGKMEKHFQENCLLEQSFVKNPDLRIFDLLKEASKKFGSDIRISRFVRFKVGEGIEKRTDNLAAEVAKITGVH